MKGKRRLASLVLLLGVLFLSAEAVSAIVRPDPGRTTAGGVSAWPEVPAESVLVVDVESGRALYEKAPHERRFPASLTKVLTGLILLQRSKAGELVIAGELSAKVGGGSTIGLQAGDFISREDLAKAILIYSANDAAVCAAENIAGSVDDFAQMMNETAARLGATESHFTNPHGLPDPNHYSTAYDLTLLARAALRNGEFRGLVALPSSAVMVVGGEGRPRFVSIENHNRMLLDYPGCDGVKSGYTIPAGHCVIATATRDGWQVMATVMKSDDAFRDAMALLDYAFANYQAVVVAEAGKPLGGLPVARGESKQVEVTVKDTVRVVVTRGTKVESRLVPNEEGLSAPINKGQEVGTLVVYGDEGEQDSYPLLAAQSVELSRLAVALRDPRFPVALVLLFGGIFWGLWAVKKRNGHS